VNTATPDHPSTDIWATLQRLADLQQKRDAAKAEVARLQGEFDKMFEQVQAAEPRATQNMLLNVLDAVRLFGAPPGAPVETPAADEGGTDPLDVPQFLKRGSGDGEAGSDGATDRPAFEREAEAVARQSAP